MSSKLIFLLLTALLLVKCSIGKPMPDAETVADVSQEEENEKEYKAENLSDSTSELWIDQSRLDMFVAMEGGKIIDEMFTNGRKLIGGLIADVNAMGEKSEALTIKIDKLTELAKKFDDNVVNTETTVDDTMGLLNEMRTLIGKLEQTNADDLIIKASLEKHGIEKMKEEREIKFAEVAAEFVIYFDKYLDSLNPEEQEAKKGFAEWLQRFKDESNIEEKIGLFLGYFSFNHQVD